MTPRRDAGIAACPFLLRRRTGGRGWAGHDDAPRRNGRAAKASPATTRAAAMAILFGAASSFLLLAGCTEHVYTIDTRDEGDGASRTVTVESRQVVGDEPAKEVDRIGQVLAETGAGGHDASTRTFQGTFAREVPDDVGSVGELCRCSSPLGTATLYIEVVRSTSNIAEDIDRAHRALDLGVDAVLQSLDDEYRGDRGFDAARVVIDRPVRTDLHHMLACSWSVSIAERLRSNGMGNNDWTSEPWWQAELATRHYLAPDEAMELFLGGDLGHTGEVGERPWRVFRMIARRCRHDGAVAASEWLERLVARLDAEVDQAQDAPADDGASPDASPSASPDTAAPPTEAARLEQAIRRHIAERIGEVVPPWLTPSGERGVHAARHPTDDANGDGDDPSEEASTILLLAIVPGLPMSVSNDEVTLRATLRGAIVARSRAHEPSGTSGDATPPTSGDGSDAGDAQPPADPIGDVPESTAVWSGTVMPRPGQGGDLGLRAWAVSAAPDEAEQRRLWGSVRLRGSELAEVACHFSALSPDDAAVARDAMRALSTPASWHRWRERHDLSDSPRLLRLVEILDGLPPEDEGGAHR